MSKFKKISNKTLKKYLEKKCLGYENRKSGKELFELLGVDPKIISIQLFELQKNGVKVFNLDYGYFIATENDTEILVKKKVNLISRYEKMNIELKLLKEIDKFNTIELEI